MSNHCTASVDLSVVYATEGNRQNRLETSPTLVRICASRSQVLKDKEIVSLWAPSAGKMGQFLSAEERARLSVFSSIVRLNKGEETLADCGLHPACERCGRLFPWNFVARPLTAILVNPAQS
jgi:hypothetical protein